MGVLITLLYSMVFIVCDPEYAFEFGDRDSADVVDRSESSEQIRPCFELPETSLPHHGACSGTGRQVRCGCTGNVMTRFEPEEPVSIALD